MISNMGDGDLVDPGDVDQGDLGLADGAPGSATGVPNTAPVDDHADTAPVDDATERSDEVDDVTAAHDRPAAGAGPEAGTATETGTATGTDDVDYSDVDVAALLAEREEYRTIAQRVQADFDNFRKRSATQARADAERATGRLAEALLPVLDAAEAAYLRHPDEVGPLLNQMLAELKKHGLEAIDLDGKPFDPEVADAVQHEPGDGGDPVVAEVLRTGYQWKGRTLRPAMVRTRD